MVARKPQLVETLKACSFEHRHSLLRQKQLHESLRCRRARRRDGYRHRIGCVGATERLATRIGVAGGLVPSLHRRVALVDLLWKIEKRETLKQRIRNIENTSMRPSRIRGNFLVRSKYWASLW